MKNPIQRWKATMLTLCSAAALTLAPNIAGPVLAMTSSVPGTQGKAHEPVGAPKKSIHEPEYLSFKKVALVQDLPQAVQNWANPLISADTPHFQTFRYEGKTYALAAWGAKPTSGYTVDITRVFNYQKDVGVKMTCTSPLAGTIVAQHVEHPFAMVIFSTVNKPVYFYTTFVDANQHMKIVVYPGGQDPESKAVGGDHKSTA